MHITERKKMYEKIGTERKCTKKIVSSTLGKLRYLAGKKCVCVCVCVRACVCVYYMYTSYDSILIL